MNTKILVTFLSCTLCFASSVRAETLEWIRQLGTSETEASYGVSADGLGSVYISGMTRGSLGGTNAGGRDGFLSKFDASGTLEWTRQFGTSEDEGGESVSADGLGSVYISGMTKGNLGGANAGSFDAFVTKYDASGTLEWTRQFGTSEYERNWGGCSADGLGSVYIAGDTNGTMVGTNAGRYDAFLVKFSEPLLGDVNLDGDVNGLDVDPFVGLVTGGTYQAEADMNFDAVVNGLDVDPFVAAVVGGTQPIPEPSTLLLCIIALGVVGGWRKWKRVA